MFMLLIFGILVLDLVSLVPSNAVPDDIFITDLIGHLGALSPKEAESESSQQDWNMTLAVVWFFHLTHASLQV